MRRRRERRKKESSFFCRSRSGIGTEELNLGASKQGVRNERRGGIYIYIIG